MVADPRSRAPSSRELEERGNQFLLRFVRRVPGDKRDEIYSCRFPPSKREKTWRARGTIGNGVKRLCWGKSIECYLRRVSVDTARDLVKIFSLLLDQFSLSS